MKIMADYFLERKPMNDRYRSFDSVVPSQSFDYKISDDRVNELKDFDSIKILLESKSRFIERPINAPEKPIQLEGWKELILKSDDGVNNFLVNPLFLGITSSYEVQAQRAGYLNCLNVSRTGLCLVRSILL